MGHTLTNEDRSAGGKLAQQKARERRLAELARREVIDRITAEIDTTQLPEYFTRRSVEALDHAHDGEMPVIETTLDYLRMVEAADKLHKMGRLAAGEATSIGATFGAHANVDLDELAAKIDRARAARDAQRTRDATHDAIDATSHDATSHDAKPS